MGASGSIAAVATTTVPPTAAPQKVEPVENSPQYKQLQSSLASTQDRLNQAEARYMMCT
jgi:hypothetical protein